jgi:8-oxo-dGTP diphosphatase
MSLPHGAAVILHHASSGRVLLQHRTDDAPAYPDHWGMFGGGGEPEDEGSPIHTACRELREELGLDVTASELVSLWDYMTPRGSHRYVFLHPWADPDYAFVLGEGHCYGWFTIEDALATLKLTDNARRDLTLLAERLKQPDEA